MNKLLRKISLALMASLAFAFSACNDDDDVKNVLVVNDFESGKFYTINKETGTLTEAFTATLDGTDFLNLRAFVYHKGENKFYASTNNNAGADLYTIDPETKTAQLIAENGAGQTLARTVVTSWSSISSLAVSKDDSLFALAYYTTATSTYGGFIKFATDGNLAQYSIDVQGSVCCGMGMIYDEDNKSVITANGWDQDDAVIDIEVFDSETGKTKYRTSIYTFEGFAEDFTDDFMAIRTMVRENNGKIYAILHNSNTLYSYFVSIDLTNKKIVRISTLSENGDKQFSGLAFIPENLAK